MDELQNLIAYISKMVNFSAEEINLFTKNITVRQYRKGSFLLQENKIAKSILFINKGITRNIVTGADGAEYTQFFSLENTFITEYASFLHGTQALYGIQCIEDCEVAEIPKEAIEQGYLYIKEGNKLGRLIAESYFVQFVRNAYDKQTKTLMQQYHGLEAQFPGIHQRVPQHMIASYLGITAVHLSRLKSQSKHM